MQEADIKAAIREAVDCYQSGDFARAEQIYRRIIAEAPKAVHFTDLGVFLKAQGKHEDAVAAFNKAIELDPKDPKPHYNLGNLFRDRGMTDEAVGRYLQAATLKPDFSDAHNNLGLLLVEKGLPEESLLHYRKAIAANPGFYYAHNNLGVALHQTGRLEEAIQCFRRVIELKPDTAEAWSNLGSAYLKLDQLDEAITSCRKAVSFNPAFADGHYNLANCYRSALRLDDAIGSYERAIGIKPDSAEYHWDYSVTLLLRGDYARGWREYEWRWQGCAELKNRKPAIAQPQWTGQDISGKRMLLYKEQGFGDVIQFIRYAPLIAGRGAKVIAACQPELVRLLGSIDGISEAVADWRQVPPFDIHCPLLSLPLLFNTMIDTIPANVPYIKADPALAEAWRQRIGTGAGLKVGLIWGGTAGNRMDLKRSCALTDFAPLAQVKGVQFYSLQKGEHAAQAKSPPAGMTLIDWTEDIGDFADTAALMANLDLIISVDTAGLHLAGALGKPAWLLNRHESDWRWLLDREDSPWYPTLRIFRQARIGDWQTVIGKIANALKELRP